MANNLGGICISLPGSICLFFKVCKPFGAITLSQQVDINLERKFRLLINYCETLMKLYLTLPLADVSKDQRLNEMRD